MTTEDTRKKITSYLPLVKLLFVGVIVGSLITGGLALNAVALTLLLAIIVIVVGAAIVIAFPQFSFTALDPAAALACVALMIFL